MRGLRPGSARSVLLTVLGELIEPVGRPVWNSSLLYVMGGMGFEAPAARQAIDRTAEAGWIEGTRFGRHVRWELTASGKDLIARGSERVHSLSAPASSWTGEWLIALITIPSEKRNVRQSLYAALSWEGFGNPTPGLWLSPYPNRADDAAAIIDDAGLADTTYCFVGPSNAVGLDDRTIVRRAWDLESVEEQYRELLDGFADREPAGGDDLLFAHLELVNAWQRFPFLDPQLPDELLGEWVGHEAARLFESRRYAWHSSAHTRWAEVAAETTPPEGRDCG